MQSERWIEVDFISIALGLTDLNKNDPVTWRFIHKAAALAFVPLAFVRVALTSIETEASDILEANEFLHYFKAVIWLLGTF